jgi:MinD superfamily P-loop ATPase
MTEIKTCGNCKSESVLQSRDSSYSGMSPDMFRIRCTGCGIRGLWHPTVEQAIEVWNKRVGESDD